MMMPFLFRFTKSFRYWYIPKMDFLICEQYVKAVILRYPQKKTALKGTTVPPIRSMGLEYLPIHLP